MLGERGTTVTKFTHPDAVRVRYRWTPNPNGGAIFKTLIVTPTFYLNPLEVTFDRARVDALADAAVKYVTDEKLNCLVVLESP
jgi:hypothetical protein